MEIQPQHILQYFLLKLLATVANMLSLDAARHLGESLGFMTYALIPRWRRRGMANLDLVFKSALTKAEKRDILRRSFMHFGAFGFEFVRILPRLTRDNIDSFFRVENLDALRSALSQGRGAILVSAHLGNWEIGSHGLSLLGIPMAVVVREFRNPLLNSFVASIRGSEGQDVVPKWGMMRQTISALKEGKAVAILGDQYARSEGVFVDFFGHPASTIRSVALLARKYGSPVLPAFVPKVGGMYVCYIDSPIEIETNGHKLSVEEITAAFTQRIENFVRRYPDQWTWFHRRWKLPGRKLPSAGQSQ